MDVTIGSFRILEELGRGGMGIVYKAVDTMLDRTVALKVVHVGFGDEVEIVDRFRSEAVILATLDHPNITRLHGLVREGDRLLMVMEFVEGETLEAVVTREGRVGVPRAVGWCGQVLDALGYAHHRNVVHRDIKPANVIVDGANHVRVMDFGIARVLGSARKTRAGQTPGTAGHMAPEQIRGEDVDARTDIYSLGVVLYELVTGEPPFRGSAGAVFSAHLTQRPVPPRELTPGLPAWIDAAVMRALEKNPSARFQTAADFKRELRSEDARLDSHGGTPPPRPLPPGPGSAPPLSLSVVDIPTVRIPRSADATVVAAPAAGGAAPAATAPPTSTPEPSLPQGPWSAPPRSLPVADVSTVRISRPADAPVAAAPAAGGAAPAATAPPTSTPKPSLPQGPGSAPPPSLPVADVSTVRISRSADAPVVAVPAAGGAAPAASAPLTSTPKPSLPQGPGSAPPPSLRVADVPAARMPRSADAAVVAAPAAGGSVPIASAPASLKTKLSLSRDIRPIPVVPIPVVPPPAGGSVPQQPSSTKQSRLTPIIFGLGATVAVIALVWALSSLRTPGSTLIPASLPGASSATAQGAPATGAAPAQSIIPSDRSSSARATRTPQGTSFSEVPQSRVVPQSSAVPQGVSPEPVNSAITDPFILWLDADTELEFKPIRAGSFRMGAEDHDGHEAPVHLVTLTRDFQMGEYEVTQEQWKAVMGTAPSGRRNCAECPVENVSWFAAQDFMRALNKREDGYLYRLPTEAEWEYAARAGTTGDHAGDLDAMAWYLANSGGETHPAGSKDDNAWGLHDMHGNVWEWVSDWYDDHYPSAAVTNPRGPESGSERVCRGGSWCYDANSSRSTYRSPYAPSGQASDVGFRLVRVRE